MYKIVIWDFDGVIVFSNEIRENGFREIFKNFPENQVDQLMNFHRANGGLSRYVKIRYFYEQVLGESITDTEVELLADQFSKQMELFMYDKSILNPDWLRFMEKEQNNLEHFIASGSDQRELRIICEKLGINHFFQNIYGSPIPKKDLVSKIIQNRIHISRDQFVLIGDAVNDLEAASFNGIDFVGYNSHELASIDGIRYADSFDNLTL